MLWCADAILQHVVVVLVVAKGRAFEDELGHGSARPKVGLVFDGRPIPAPQIRHHHNALRISALEVSAVSIATTLRSRYERGLPSIETLELRARHFVWWALNGMERGSPAP
jgi:hypothetical protein